MSLSLLNSPAPQQFLVAESPGTSPEPEPPSARCPLCRAARASFHCELCIRMGSFVSSALPHSDRFAEKQLKLLRMKVNRRYVQERCEAILLTKSEKDRLETEVKRSQDRVQLIKLAIEEKRKNVDEKKSELDALKQYNIELCTKLPKYEKRVATLGKHSQIERSKLEHRSRTYCDKAESLAALRRARIRQLYNYIFPVMVSYDTSDSVEELEFLQVAGDREERGGTGATGGSGGGPVLHVCAAWLPAHGELPDLPPYSPHCEPGAPPSPLRRVQAALALSAQLAALLAWCLDARLPHLINFREWSSVRVSPASAARVSRRVRGCARAVCARGGQPPPPPARALLALHTLAVAANTDDPALGRVEGWVMWEACGGGELQRDQDSSDDEPEHLTWHHLDQEEEAGSPPTQVAAPSLVTSAAASIVSIWRGLTK